ncbi:MAG: sigma-54-dependent Fis family transcriptional regulator [Nitrospinae bacterium]|nr:sigma-54-dependent Fis family transcriptional regulator [Nitrospinota bacterium]
MSRPNILVVDDEPEMRSALTHTLERVGLCVSTAVHGVEAWEKLQAQPFDLLITDVRMPRMDGLALLHEMKRTTPAIPVVMMTAYGRVEDAVQAMKVGAFDYLLKPFSLEDLQAVVSKALARGDGRTDDRASMGTDTPGYQLPSPSNGGHAAERPVVTQDPRMLLVIELAREVAHSKATVLIQGESGTGKELLARFIHAHSPRSGEPFVAVNCAAIPEGLLESELFGHEKGAFTGAASKSIGKFEWAHQGTILLDEISEMPLPLQAKLLRVLQEREIERLGGRKPISVDIRVIATTNRRLKDYVTAGKFREDLFYRLNVIPLTIPPLRERKGDIPLLLDHCIRKHSRGASQPIPRVSQETLQYFCQYDWPGNVRELENMVERWLVLNQGELARSSHFFLEEGTSALATGGGVREPLLLKPRMSVKAMERTLILDTLEAVEGNRTQAAKILGISLRTLRNKLREYKTTGLRTEG